MTIIHVCGVFEADVKLLPGETENQAKERVEAHLLKILDKYARRLNVNISVDYDD